MTDQEKIAALGTPERLIEELRKTEAILTAENIALTRKLEEAKGGFNKLKAFAESIAASRDGVIAICDEALASLSPEQPDKPEGVEKMTAPASCPCIDEDDCSNVAVCRAVEEVCAPQKPEAVETYSADMVLPCDVRLPPRTIIRKGCTLRTLMAGLSQRERWQEDVQFQPEAVETGEPFGFHKKRGRDLISKDGKFVTTPELAVECAYVVSCVEAVMRDDNAWHEIDFILRDYFSGRLSNEELFLLLTAERNASETQSKAAPTPEAVATGEPVAEREEIEQMIEALLDAQQDINLAANTTMDQSLCNASALIDKVEVVLRRAMAASPVPDGEARRKALIEKARSWDRCWPGNLHIEGLVDELTAALVEVTPTAGDATNGQ